MFVHRVRTVAFFVVLLLSFVGCKHKPGDKCSGSQTACFDPATALECLNGVQTALPCRGPGGCSVKGTTLTCDNAVVQDGDGCDTAGDIECAVDHKAVLECKDNKYQVVETCKGSRG